LNKVKAQKVAVTRLPSDNCDRDEHLPEISCWHTEEWQYLLTRVVAMQMGEWGKGANEGRAMGFGVVRRREKRTGTSYDSGAHCALI
jgi:hypothetical protein